MRREHVIKTLSRKRKLALIATKPNSDPPSSQERGKT